jgi:hypothetical protein
VSRSMAAMHLADGPAMYFGGTIMTFALPMGAFIVATIVLYYLFRADHAGPKLKYPTTAPFSSVGTREPGPVPAPPVAKARTETGGPETTTRAGTAEATAEPED